MLAIPTQYKGYRFRSRLEARWAVFLDALNAKWSYEKKGYILEGHWYLPDFWVEDWNTWIEIKGKLPSGEEHTKCRLLAESSGKRYCSLQESHGRRMIRTAMTLQSMAVTSLTRAEPPVGSSARAEGAPMKSGLLQTTTEQSRSERFLTKVITSIR